MACHDAPKRAEQGPQSRDDGHEPPLQAAWRADADQLPHEQTEIESGCVHEQPFSNVRVPAQMDTSHPARLKEMGERPFQALTAEPQQAQAACAADASPIAIDGGTRLRLLCPVASPAIGLRDVAADTDGFKINERLIAVIALVRHHGVETVAVGTLRLYLLGRLN